MSILVVGATGGVGREVLSQLVSKGINARGMTRYPARIDKLPSGAEGCVADLDRPDTLTAAFDGIDSVFLISPLSRNESEEGCNAVAAAKAAGVGKIVYMSVPMPEGSTHIPHFKSKIPIEEAIKQSGIPYTVLRPNNFFQNDYWGKAAILHYGVYPQPIGNVGLNRVDIRDIATAAVNALLNSGFEGREFAINGAEVLTGDSVAAVFSRHLNRDIRYGGDDLEAWGKQAQHMMPQWMVEDFRVMYDYFQQHGLKADPADLEKQQQLLGGPPRGFDAFVEELAAEWREPS